MSLQIIPFSRTFFLLQATHAVGARNGGGLKSFILLSFHAFIVEKSRTVRGGLFSLFSGGQFPQLLLLTGPFINYIYYRPSLARVRIFL